MKSLHIRHTRGKLASRLRLGASLGERVHSARRDMGLSLREFSTRVGISAGHLSNIENNRSLPSLHALAKIAGALRRRLDWLVEPLNDEGLIPGLGGLSTRAPVLSPSREQKDR
jgi:transcriptional regulator with XRE-family HTH domain